MKILSMEALSISLLSSVIVLFVSTANATTTVSAAANGFYGSSDSSTNFYTSYQPAVDSPNGQSLAGSDTPINGSHLVTSNYGYIKVGSSVGSDFLNGIGDQFTGANSRVEGSWFTTFNPGAASQITINFVASGGIDASATSASHTNQSGAVIVLDASSQASAKIEVNIAQSDILLQGDFTADGLYGKRGNFNITTNGASRAVGYNELFSRHSLTAKVIPFQDNIVRWMRCVRLPPYTPIRVQQPPAARAAICLTQSIGTA